MTNNFSTEEWIAHLKTYDIPSLNDWLIGQANMGVDYFLNRLDMLGLSGEHVLDAGCGAGNWTIVLAKRFNRVLALDADPIRLQIVSDMAPKLGEVKTALGSTESINCPRETFDAIFCSGVIFITDCEKTISEFIRVLKPGGQLYMSFVGENWWRFLLNERGRNEPPCIKFGADGLISLVFRRLDEIELSTFVSAKTKSTAVHLIRNWLPDWLPRFLDSPAAMLSRYVAAEGSLPTDLISEALALLDFVLSEVMQDPLRRKRAIDVRRVIKDLTKPYVPTLYRERIVRDFLSRVLTGTGNYSFDVHTYTYEPEDMTEILMQKGFKEILVANEGGLRVDTKAPTAMPIYPRENGVYEVLCTKT